MFVLGKEVFRRCLEFGSFMRKFMRKLKAQEGSLVLSTSP